MYSAIRENWFAIDSKLVHNLKIYSDKEKRINEETTDDFINVIERYIKERPKDKKKIETWELEGEKIVLEFVKNNNLMNLSNLELETQKDIINVTKGFIKKAKEFDKGISGEYISQGLRNMWIINILQLIFEKRAEFTVPAFAYSMIYPYTDNFLDDVNVSSELKKEFNKKISLMIKGQKVTLKGRLENKIYKLLKDIESGYNRKSFKGVYESLLAIHNGQVRSMEQQEVFSIPYEKDILSISIEKGGASVLADGYIVKGELKSEEKEFCLKYGFLLQMIDDFQDLKNDMENNHVTIISQLAGKYYLDNIVNKLINYAYYVFDDTKFIRDKQALRNVMKENCLLLILCSISLNKQYFSMEYIDRIERYLPFRSSYIKKLSETTMKKVKKLEGIL